MISFGHSDLKSLQKIVFKWGVHFMFEVVINKTKFKTESPIEIRKWYFSRRKLAVLLYLTQ